MNISDYVSEDILRKFELYNYNHALEILTQSFPGEWQEIENSLRSLSISINELRKLGGNKSEIPDKFDKVLYPLGWKEIQISGDLHIKIYPRVKKGFAKKPSNEFTLEGYIDGHNIDFVKNRVAFDLEWNSKDQTFDRDLLAMRTYYDCDVISVGVIVTRSEELNDVFKTIYDYDSRAHEWKPIMRKYGASTTWIGKLTTRLDSRRNGGCPILAIGIKKPCITDWEEGYIDEHAPRND
ncbi:MAG: restriction endonuclease [Clostridia bacterium]|nr:restriction endonuclease [Clostridia bacterium]